MYKIGHPIVMIGVYAPSDDVDITVIDLVSDKLTTVGTSGSVSCMSTRVLSGWRCRVGPQK